MNVLITGACGFLGHQTVEKLKKYNENAAEPIRIIATDVKAKPNFSLDEDTLYDKVDVRSKEMMSILKKKKLTQSFIWQQL